MLFKSLRNIILSLYFLFIFTYAQASQVSTEEAPVREDWKFPYTQEVGVFTGFASGSLKTKDKYRIIPGVVRLGYNLDTIGLGFRDLIKPITNKLKVKPKGYTEVILEPFLNTVVTPNTNIEAGCTLLLKFAYPATEKLYPYGIAGGGVMYFTQHTREQGTQYGFTPQVGAGITYHFQENLAFNAEYRYRHLSNASIKQPNSGINVDMFMLGVSLFY